MARLTFPTNPLSQWRRAAAPEHGQPMPLLWRVLLPLLMLGALVLAWQLLAASGRYPAFLVPSPRAVAERFWDVTGGDARVRLLPHIRATGQAVLLGLAAGLSAALLLGLAVTKVPGLEAATAPLIVALQATPVVAYAPLLVIWFGSGVQSRALTSALVVFFPMLLTAIVGLRSVPPALREVFRLHRATPWQTFTLLEVPAALPVLLGGLKISATLAVIGAVVGEFVNASAGLGYLINAARSAYDTPLMLVAVLTLTGLALVLYGCVALLEARALAWQRRGRRAALLAE